MAASAGLIGDLCSAFGGGNLDGDCADFMRCINRKLKIGVNSFDLLSSLMLPQVAIVTLLDVEPISDLLTAGRRSKTSKTKTLSTWATKEIRYLPTCVQTLDSKACFTQETEECDEHGALRAFSG